MTVKMLCPLGKIVREIWIEVMAILIMLTLGTLGMPMKEW